MERHLMKYNLRGKYLDGLIKYGIAAILIVVPLYPKFPFLSVPGIYVSIRIEDFLILTVTILWFVRNFNSLIGLLKNPIIRAIVIFFVATFIATFSGAFFLKTTSSTLVGFLEWARRVEYLMGFFVAFTSIRSIKDVEFYVKCIGLVILIVFIFGLGQKYFNFPVITTQNSEYSKGIALRYVSGTQLVSTFAGHYDLASYMLITSPIFVAILFMKKEELKKFLGVNERLGRFIVFLVVAVSFWLMVNAASRITAAAYLLAISLSLFLIRKYKYILIAIIATVIFTFSTSNLFDRYLNILNVLKSKLIGFLVRPVYAQSTTSISTPAPIQDLSTSIRLNVEWPRAVRAFLKNPLFGTGYSSTTLATDNDYLRALAETGILGFVSLFFVFLRIIQNLLISSWPGKFFAKKELNFKNVYLVGVIAVIPGVLLNAIFIDIFEASKFAIPFWFLIGFAAALVLKKNYEEN